MSMCDDCASLTSGHCWRHPQTFSLPLPMTPPESRLREALERLLTAIEMFAPEVESDIAVQQARAALAAAPEQPQQPTVDLGPLVWPLEPPAPAADVRCPYRAGWCEKDAGHDGEHYTTYRDGERWTAQAGSGGLDVERLARCSDRLLAAERLLMKWDQWASLTWKPTDRSWQKLLDDTRATLVGGEAT